MAGEEKTGMCLNSKQRGGDHKIKEYTNDVIILPSTVRDNWWRKEGHNLCLDDLVDAIKNEPDVIIVGTGNLGLMKISDELIEKLKSLNAFVYSSIRYVHY